MDLVVLEKEPWVDREGDCAGQLGVGTQTIVTLRGRGTSVKREMPDGKPDSDGERSEFARFI